MDIDLLYIAILITAYFGFVFIFNSSFLGIDRKRLLGLINMLVIPLILFIAVYNTTISVYLLSILDIFLMGILIYPIIIKNRSFFVLEGGKKGEKKYINTKSMNKNTIKDIKNKISSFFNIITIEIFLYSVIVISLILILYYSLLR